jgi:hypothetical protein
MKPKEREPLVRVHDQAVPFPLGGRPRALPVREGAGILVDPRISSSSRPTKKVFVNHFKITDPAQIDNVFAGWVEEAYSVGTGLQREPAKEAVA